MIYIYNGCCVWHQFCDRKQLFICELQNPGPTLPEVLPEWPVYLLFIEAMGLAMFLLLYLLFIYKDWRGVKNPLSGGAK